MKPISISSSSFVSAAEQQTKPHLPPKPIKYRTSSASSSAAAAAATVASYIDDLGEHLHQTELNSSSIDDQESLSVRRSKLNQAHLTHHPIRHQNNNQHPSPQPHPDQGPHWFPPSAPNKNLGVSRDRATARPPGPRCGGGGGRSLRHSESRTERMKLDRERFLANLIQSEEDNSNNRLTHKTNIVTRHPSLPPSSISISSSSICPNSKTIQKRPIIITNEISSHPKPTSRTSSCAKNPAVVTSSSTMEVTSSSSKKPTVTSLDVTAGGDVIYDEPSTLEFERKSLDRLVLSDGYLKLRSDVIEEQQQQQQQQQEEKSMRVTTQTPTHAAIVRLNNHRADKRRPLPPPAPLPPFKSTSSSSSTSGGLRPSRSSESVDRLEALLDFSDFGGGVGLSSGRGPLRSSFVDPNGPPSRRSVYIELGEYQTLLKHSRNDDDECLYSLPQPLCYSEDTLKAVKLITEKYDTFKRRQLRDLSFRDGTVTNRKSTDNGGGGGVEAASLRSVVVPSVEQTSSIKESNNNKSNLGGCSVQGVTADDDNVTDATIEQRDTDAKTRVEGSGATGKRVCAGDGRVDAVAKSKQQTGSLLLRDYCNTLETGVDGAAADSAGGLSKLNLMRIELFYRSQEASIFVCRSLADLFVGGNSSVGEDSSCPLLVHQHTGVPVWLLNSGEGGVRGRELLLFVAERETGFPLWQDKINYLSNYDEVSPGVHSLRVSGSLRKTVRLHMFCERSAAEFMARFRELTSDPNDDLWKISSKDATTTTTTTTTTDSSRNRSGQTTTTTKANKKKTSKKKKRGSRLSKASISHPCNFVHISRVDPTDPNFRAAFSGLIPLRPCSNSSGGGKTPTTADHPGKALNMGASNSEDPSKAFDNVDPAAANDYFESAAADSSSVCEFRPRLPTR